VLTFPYSETFYNSEQFRGRILHFIENPRMQLDLIFNRFSRDPDNSMKKNTVQLDLQRLRKISVSGDGFPVSCQVIPFPNLDVGEISLRGIKIKDLTYFSNVKNVCFSSGEKIDFALLQHIEKGIFRATKCANYDSLCNLQSLEISHCDTITDVSCFANIPDLNLTSCDNINDVSPLSRVHTLDLSWCRGITDVSPLRNVHILILDFCFNITDISGLENVYSLSFRKFQGKNVSGLRNVVVLDIADAENVSNISALHSVRVLVITGCLKIKKLAGLTSLKALTIDNGNKITSGNETFQQLVKLDITIQVEDEEPRKAKLWEDFDMLTTLSNLKHLVVTGFTTLTEFPSMENLVSLELCDCKWLSTLIFPALPLLESLTISQCHALESVHLLGDAVLKFSLEKFVLDFNPAMTRVQIDRRVSRCTIVDSSELKVIELHQQIGYLRCPLENGLERIVNQSWVVYLNLEKYGVVSRPPVLDKEKDELMFEKAVKNELSSCVEEDDEEDGGNDDDEEHDDEEEEEEEDGSGAESNDDDDDENESDSVSDDEEDSDSSSSGEDN
jgi:hypothetical protein